MVLFRWASATTNHTSQTPLHCARFPGLLQQRGYLLHPEPHTGFSPPIFLYGVQQRFLQNRSKTDNNCLQPKDHWDQSIRRMRPLLFLY